MERETNIDIVTEKPVKSLASAHPNCAQLSELDVAEPELDLLLLSSSNPLREPWSL